MFGMFYPIAPALENGKKKLKILFILVIGLFYDWPQIYIPVAGKAKIKCHFGTAVSLGSA